MKTAKAAPSDLSSSRRAQPVRQTRVNPPRSSIPNSRPFGPRGSLNGGLEEKDIEIFPAITHFADAITALPKELMRHFTLLKEVDAKIFGPEEDLGMLVNAALNTPLAERRPQVDTQHNHGPSSTAMSAQGSTNGSIVNGHPASVASVPDVEMAYDAANIPRRQVFQHCAFTMQNMLVSLDEKNHVISTAAEALSKQLARIDDCFPYIELEISEEARYGSTTHWAYPENRLGKSAATNSSRRDVAPVNTLSAAAQAVADEAAQRSETRKQALLEKKKNHNKTHAESDFDDHHENRPKEKKVHGNSKVRKAAEPSSIGLGITNGATTNGHAPKRRKVEKGPSGGVVMERALSGVFGANGTATKGKAASPRETPGPDGPKKKPRGAAAANGQPRKRNNTVTTAMSPSLASSPIRSTFPELKVIEKATPPPTNGARPSTSRARQNSTHSLAETARQRQESVASTKQNGNSTSSLEAVVSTPANGRIIPEVKPVAAKEAVSKAEPVVDDVEKNGAAEPERIVPGIRRESIPKREEPEINGGAVQSLQIATIITTKSGRASKPSTPAMPSFPDPPSRSRSSRNALDNNTSNKRSHKKGAGAAAQLIAQAQQQNLESMDDNQSSNLGEEDEEEEIGADEPTYCYCNGVSYGEMVACDGNGCAKEWFHLECAGLKVAPRGNAKWYCNECKEKLKTKRFNSR